MSPANVHIPETGWSEPAILWITTSMLTGSRKSTLHHYLVSIVRQAKDEVKSKGEFMQDYTMLIIICIY